MKINTNHITCIFILFCINSIACLSNEKKGKIKDKLLLKKKQTKEKSSTNDQKILKNTKLFKTDSSKYEEIMKELNDDSNEKDLAQTLKGAKIDQYLEKQNIVQQKQIENSQQITQNQEKKTENIRLQKSDQKKLESKSEKIEVKKVEKSNTEIKQVQQTEKNDNTTKSSTSPQQQQQQNMQIQQQIARQNQLLDEKRKLEEQQKQKQIIEQINQRQQEKEKLVRQVQVKNSTAPCIKNYSTIAQPDEDMLLDKETKKQIRDLHIMNQLNGDFSSTVLTDHLSEYSQQVLKEQRQNSQQYLLSRLRHYEEGSSYNQGPSFISSVQSPVVTQANIPDPAIGEQLWQQRKPNPKFKSVIYKQSSDHINQIRVGNQVYETTVPEKIVGIRNQLELDTQENQKMEKNYESLTRMKNPLQRQAFSHEKLQDKQLQVNKAIKHVENSNLFNKLASDLDDLE